MIQNRCPYAFYYCTNLKSVVFANDSQLKVIGYDAFYGCKSLQSIAIPDGVTTIGLWAFYLCTNLASVLFTDQSCLQEIGEGAFQQFNMFNEDDESEDESDDEDDVEDEDYNMTDTARMILSNDFDADKLVEHVQVLTVLF